MLFIVFDQLKILQYLDKIDIEDIIIIVSVVDDRYARFACPVVDVGVGDIEAVLVKLHLHKVVAFVAAYMFLIFFTAADNGGLLSEVLIHAVDQLDKMVGFKDRVGVCQIVFGKTLYQCLDITVDGDFVLFIEIDHLFQKGALFFGLVYGT